MIFIVHSVPFLFCRNIFSLTLIIVCVCFLLIIDILSFYLLVSYFLIQFMHHYYCHQRTLIAKKNVVFFSINQAKLVKLLITWAMLHVICYLLLTSVNKSLFSYVFHTYVSRVKRNSKKFNITLIMAIINMAFVFIPIAYVYVLYFIQIFMISENYYQTWLSDTLHLLTAYYLTEYAPVHV